MADASRLKATIFVGGLDNAVTSQVLHEAFMPFGDVVNVTLPKPDLPSSVDPHRGFGYVEFEETEDAEEAIYNMDQSELFGRVIKVAAAKPQKEHNEGLGSKNAIWETEAYAAKYNVSEEDRQVAEREGEGSSSQPMDPMQGLEGLDEAGPKPE
ncbi:putative peptidyl prolyl cis-trans isomerase cyclophilin [Lindgomyces ingoldianus]|uniref:Peptidyl prolyl cis-trans isomerase cyclophilin n=1 Tax=Lindgomyces ingoldianus TaxID=673940 RepID=A0ACB6QUB5_9PLEO|nr:putative peptidyl prolyl cis-trans isomerase cyclophilin [Lindgomyces ingoldianus]KAF2470594.1 putative peptidyl prolyl cis-trans isomerase cyclophilin [Lindgomyces ingoldianus]